MYAYCFLREKSSLHIIFTSINNQKSNLRVIFTNINEQLSKSTRLLGPVCLFETPEYVHMSFSFRLKSFQTKPINFCLLFLSGVL